MATAAERSGTIDEPGRDGDPRYDIERRKWDAHAHHHDLDQPIVPLDPNETFESFAGDKLTLAGVVEHLGPLEGKRLLEYGCGVGQLTVLLARSGAHVTAFDISDGSIAVARRRAEVNAVADRIEFVVARGEALPFPDEAFDLAFGKAVLHHLIPEEAAPELARVLRPGGRAAFSEPLGMNPFLVFARDRLPYPGKHERGADVPLRSSDLTTWGAPFRSMRWRPIHLLAMVERALGWRRIPLLRRLDERLLGRFPALGRLCRYAVLYFDR